MLGAGRCRWRSSWLTCLRSASCGPQLPVVDLGVQPRRAQQLVVRAAWRRCGPCSSTRIRSARRTVLRRWAMTKEVRPAHQPLQRHLDQPLGLGVHAGGGVVQDQDARVLEQRAGDGDALLLPAGEGDAALAHAACRSRRASAMMNSCAWAAWAAATISSSLASGPAKGDVLADRGGKEGRLLQDDADLVAQRAERHAADVVAVDRDPARRSGRRSAGSG